MVYVKAGVKQGCVLSGFLFLLVIDWASMCRTTEQVIQGFDGS